MRALAALALVVARGLAWVARWSRRRPERETRARGLPADPRAELAVAILLLGAALAAVGAVVVYVSGADTQLLGLTLGAAMGLAAVALVLAGNAVVPQERAEEERAAFARPDAGCGATGREAEALHAEVRTGLEGITRRRLLVTAGGAAGCALGAALVIPVASLGPDVDSLLSASPWHDGVRLVDGDDAWVRADELEQGSFLTAFPEGADKRAVASPVVVVRVPPAQLELPADRAGWAPDGYLAYSKICTHAGCAVNLYRSPLYPERSPGPALVCPCHYSTFDVLRGGERVFGPAGRALPQLPLRIDAGHLVAAGGYSGVPGPAWRGTRES